MEVIDVVKYFAKFPNRNGVLKNFKRKSGSAEYNELRDYITALPVPVMPELCELVFSSDAEEVMDRIENIDNYFMFVEYGSITARHPDQVRIRKIDFSLAVYICYHGNDRNMDSMGEAIIMDNCLQKCFDIAAQMISDDNQICPHERFAESAISFSPIEPASMFGSIGWGITFKKANNLEL